LHEQALDELEAYAPIVTVGSYRIVWDIILKHVPKSLFADRPCGPRNNPETARREYPKSHPEFVLNGRIQNKLLITVASDGFLKRIA
jgi:cephalosporin hydroxylase